jgi:hypothetical protein
MSIIYSTMEDLDAIFKLYEAGTQHQKTVSDKHWAGFEQSLVEQEIREHRQWKIMEGDQIACIFVITFNDPFIWKEKDKDPAIYLHRITTNPLFRGNGYVTKIVAWAKAYSDKHGIRFIRMDTGSGNEKLNNYYVSCGFDYLGVTGVADNADLPTHYRGGTSSLFEIQIHRS